MLTYIYVEVVVYRRLPKGCYTHMYLYHLLVVNCTGCASSLCDLTRFVLTRINATHNIIVVELVIITVRYQVDL